MWKSVSGVLFLSWLFLGVRYSTGHFLGAAICVAAIALLIVTDEEYSSGSGAHNVILGDSLVLFGASLYAVSNVLQENLLGATLDLHSLLFPAEKLRCFRTFVKHASLDLHCSAHFWLPI